MPHLPTFEELCDIADDQQFNETISNSYHVLHTLLPPPAVASQHFNLKRRNCTLTLPERGILNFITRLLYKHQLHFLLPSSFLHHELSTLLYLLRSGKFCIKRHDSIVPLRASLIVTDSI